MCGGLLSNSKNNKSLDKFSRIELAKRIEENYQFKIDKFSSAKYIDEINTICVKVNLERATADNVTVFRDNMKTHLGSRYKKFIIDLSDALFMDSSFLGSLILILKQISAKGGTLSLVINVDKIKILSPFEQLKKILKVYTTLEDAIQYMQEVE